MTYEDILLNLVNKDDRYFILTAENRAAIRNLPGKIGNKFIDTGISEMTLVGVSAGLALRGRIPVAHSLSSFLTMRAFEFIRTDVGGFPGVLSEANGPTHQAIEDISLMKNIPNIQIFAPADENDLLIGIEAILADDCPYYIRFNNYKGDFKHSTEFTPGVGEVIGNGVDVGILVYGTLFKEALKVKKLLEKKGLSARLINLRTIKPLDEDSIFDALTQCSLTVTIEDHFINSGLYSLVAEICLKRKIITEVMPFGFDNKWFKPAMLEDVLLYEGIDANSMYKKIISKLTKHT